MKTTPAQRPDAPVAASRPTPEDAPARPLLAAAGAWDRFWFAPADPTSLGLIRICAGLVILYVHVAYSFLLFSYVSPGAWLDNQAIDYLRDKLPISIPGWDWQASDYVYTHGTYRWSLFFDVQDPAGIVAVHVGIILASLLFTLGAWTRVTSVLCWVGALSYIHRAPSTLFGMDTMLSIVLFYLVIGPSGAALSLDRLWQKRRARRQGDALLAAVPPASAGANFAVRLIQVHFCIIYLASGFSKLQGASWWNGTAPSRVLLNPEFAPFNVALYYNTLVFLTKHRFLWEVFMGVGIVFTFFVEIGFPFLVWSRRMRWVMVTGSVLLHTNIALFMGLTSFSLLMLAMVLAFVPPQVVRHAVNGVAGQARQLFRGPKEGRAAAAAPDRMVLTRT